MLLGLRRKTAVKRNFLILKKKHGKKETATTATTITTKKLKLINKENQVISNISIKRC